MSILSYCFEVEKETGWMSRLWSEIEIDHPGQAAGSEHRTMVKLSFLAGVSDGRGRRRKKVARLSLSILVLRAVEVATA